MRKVDKGHVESFKANIHSRIKLYEAMMEARDDKCIPLWEIAEYLSIPTQRLIDWEQGEGLLDHRLILGYASYVGLTVEYKVTKRDEETDTGER